MIAWGARGAVGGEGVDEVGAGRLGEDRGRRARRAEVDAAGVHRLQERRAGGELEPLLTRSRARRGGPRGRRGPSARAGWPSLLEADPDLAPWPRAVLARPRRRGRRRPRRRRRRGGGGRSRH
jgi:hypothetical protein